jgi:hypothetical protein
MLRTTGVIKDGKAISYEDMSEMLRREILGLNVTFSSAPLTDRYELVVRGSGNDLAESARAVEWMSMILKTPNWSAANLPRMRDVIDQQLSGLQRRMQDPEETWVTNPSDAFRYQDRPAFLATNSFLTQAHNFFRVRWMLKDRGDAASAAAIDKYLTVLGSVQGSRAERLDLLKTMQNGRFDSNITPIKELSQLPAPAKALALEAAKDLAMLLPDLPDPSMAADWKYLCETMRSSLAQGPEKKIAKLNEVRSSILNVNTARMFYIGSTATRQKLEPSFTSLLGGFSKLRSPDIRYSSSRIIDGRVNARTGTTERPIYAGLLAPNMPGGVILNFAPVAGYKDTDREKILDFLAAKLYGGGGAHAVFTKTVASGLAYSNGISNSPESGLMRYYAERTPLIPQTLGFVVDEVKRPMDTPLVDYVTALSFSSRASAPYETRGEAMAADMADGRTPDVVRNFRRAILEARKIPDLSKQLYDRKDRIYERVLPGYGAKGRDVAGASYFSIGPEKQLAAYEEYLKKADGPETRLFRLYPRDFWLVRR